MAHPIALILAKQFASHLTIPVFLIDPTGRLVYYNEPAELLLGHRYDETGELPMQEWGTMFQPQDIDGVPLAPNELPLAHALEKRTASHRIIFIQGMDGVRRQVAITAVPLEGEGETFHGALALFWESEPA